MDKYKTGSSCSMNGRNEKCVKKFSSENLKRRNSWKNRCRLGNNIKKYFKYQVREYVFCIDLAQYRDHGEDGDESSGGVEDD